MPSPIKELLPVYRLIESDIAALIARKFLLPPFLPDVVRQIDQQMTVTEASQLLTGASGPWWEKACYPPPFPDLRIEPWPPERARQEFVTELAAVWPPAGAAHAL